MVSALLDLGVPEFLGGGPMTTDGLAAAAGADHGRMRRLLVLAVAIGLLEQQDRDVFANTDASELLRADHPHSMRIEALHVLAPWSRIAWDGLDAAVVTGGSSFAAATGCEMFDYLAAHPDEASAFHAFQAQVTKRNAAALIAHWNAPSGATLIDVGGGTGELLAAALVARPDLRGVVVDRASAVATATARSAGDPRLAGRLTAVVGDFFSFVPGGGDVYVLSHVLHDWDDDDAVRILRTVASAMTAEAILLLVENVDDDPNSLLVAYLDMLMLTAWGSRERSVGEYDTLLGRAGLRLTGGQVLEPRSRLWMLNARPS